MTATHPHTVASAARQLGISLRTMQRRIAAGEVDAVKVHPRNPRNWRTRAPNPLTAGMSLPSYWRP